MSTSLTGWGRGVWSSGEWGVANPLPVTGISSTGAVGNVSVSAAANVLVTGISSTGAVGNVSVSAAANVAVSGLSATMSSGKATIAWQPITPSQSPVWTQITGPAASWQEITPNQVPNWVEIAA